MEPAEFCSDAWVDNARTILGELMAEYGPQVTGQRHSLVESFDDPPAHLRHRGEHRALWSFTIEPDGSFEVGREDLVDPVGTGAGDHGQARLAAKEIYPTDADSLRARREAWMRTMSEERRARYARVSPAMQRMMVEYHNRVAALTI
jgi:hypothetical protein